MGIASILAERNIPRYPRHEDDLMSVRNILNVTAIYVLSTLLLAVSASAQYQEDSRTQYVTRSFQDATGDGKADFAQKRSFDIRVIPSDAEDCPPSWSFDFPFGCASPAWGLPAHVLVALQTHDFDAYADVLLVSYEPHPILYLLVSGGCPAWSTPYLYGCKRAFGLIGDIFVEAMDIDGDSRIDPVLFRPSSGAWFALPSSGTCPRFWTSIADFCELAWGLTGDNKPIGGLDLDNDGLADAVIRRGRKFLVHLSGGGACPSSWQRHGSFNGCEVSWGRSSDLVIVGRFSAGASNIGIIRGNRVYPVGLNLFNTASPIRTGPGRTVWVADVDGDEIDDIGIVIANALPNERNTILVDTSSNNCPTAYDEFDFRGAKYCQIIETP